MSEQSSRFPRPEQESMRREARVRRWQIGGGAHRRAPVAGGPSIEIVVGADDGAPVGVLDVTMPVHGAMPEHDHGDSAVLLVPVSGRLRLVDANESVTELEPGALATIPVAHRVRLENAGETEARLLVVLTPGSFAARVEEWPAEERVALR